MSNAIATLIANHDGPPWPVFIVFPIFFTALLAILITSRRGCGRRGGEAVLAERYARGEIEAREYHERKQELKKR
jgi:uncharacterized membrane protein